MGRKFTDHHRQRNPPTFTLPAYENLSPYIERYVQGEGLRSIAGELGIAVETLRRRFKVWSLTGKADKTYADLNTESMAMRIAIADELLETGSTMRDIARAEKMCRYSRMDFERRRPHLYGAKVEMSLTGPPAIFLGLSTHVIQHIDKAIPHNLIEAQVDDK